MRQRKITRRPFVGILMCMSYWSQKQCVGPVIRPMEQAQLALLLV